MNKTERNVAHGGFMTNASVTSLSIFMNGRF